MPAFISSLDTEYISLKRAALLIAREQLGIDPSDVMETFKHALFGREFECEESGIAGIHPGDDRNFPQLRVVRQISTLNADASRSNTNHMNTVIVSVAITATLNSRAS